MIQGGGGGCLLFYRATIRFLETDRAHACMRCASLSRMLCILWAGSCVHSLSYVYTTRTLRLACQSLLCLHRQVAIPLLILLIEYVYWHASGYTFCMRVITIISCCIISWSCALLCRDNCDTLHSTVTAVWCTRVLLR